MVNALASSLENVLILVFPVILKRESLGALDDVAFVEEACLVLENFELAVEPQLCF
jgi:hypothetical protein